MNPRVAVITNVLPSYRASFYSLLVDELGDDLKIYCQRRIPGLNIKTSHESFPNHVRLVKAFSLSREKIAWQLLPIKELLSNYDVFFFTGNPRVVSTVLLASLLRILRKPVVIWGQRHSAGANPLLENIRLSWWRLFKFIFLYTDKEVTELRASGFSRQTLIGMNNGLDQLAIDREKEKWLPGDLTEWQDAKGLTGKTLIMSCARLEEKNNFHHMISALPAIIARVPNVLWVVVGDGSEKEFLHRHAQEAGVASYIQWIGAVHGEAALAPWFLSAQIFVHPGAIGLSLMHAYGYGLPVITHNVAESHMPEFAAMTEANLEFCCEPESPADLAKKLLSLLSAPQKIAELSTDVLSVTEHFNVTVMAARFMQMVNSCTAPSKTKSTAPSEKPTQ